MKEIDDLRNEFNQRLDKLEKKVKKKKVPFRKDDRYYIINSCAAVAECSWYNGDYNFYHLYRNMIWTNKDDCIRYNEIDQKYRKLVYELNLENPIDYNNVQQEKFFLYYNIKRKSIYTDSNYEYKLQIIYCTDKQIQKKAIALIGQDDLEWYLKNYRA